MRLTTSCCLLVFLIPLSCTVKARGDVTHTDKRGFSVRIELPIQAPPQKVYRQLVDNIGDWWESSHTFSGSASNLYLEAEAKGWLGERLPEGGVVQHMEVIFAAPGKVLRLRGALGPLQEYPVTGIMTWSLTPQGDETKLVLTYRVGGYIAEGLDSFATPVDQVITSQCKRLKQFAETGKAG